MDEAKASVQDRWARLRFAVVGPLLSAPPAAGELARELTRLAEKVWRYPASGMQVRFARSSIERWYYAARAEPKDPVAVLRRRVRKDAGRARGVSPELGQAIRAQYQGHPSWSYQLHVDNLHVLVEQHPELGALPSYTTLRRWMKAHGLFKQRRRARPPLPGEARAELRRSQLETRASKLNTWARSGTSGSVGSKPGVWSKVSSPWGGPGPGHLARLPRGRRPAGSSSTSRERNGGLAASLWGEPRARGPDAGCVPDRFALEDPRAKRRAP
jgi:hypothetical protein